MNDPRIEAVVKELADDNDLTPVRDTAKYVLAAADAVDPLRGDGVIIIELPEEPMGNVVHDYTYSPHGNYSDDSPEWHRTTSGEWKGYKDGGKEYSSWTELVRRWGPLTVPVP